MVESKKALPKEPRLGYYNGYGPGPMPFGPFSPPGPPRYPAGFYGTGGQYPFGGGPRSYGPTGHHGYGAYQHPYLGYDRDQWMHEQYGSQNYNSAYFNNHRAMGNSNVHLDNSVSSAGGTYGYDHNTEMKYYHSSPPDSKQNSFSEDRQNGNSLSLMPGSYNHRSKEPTEEITRHVGGVLNNSGFSNKFSDQFEESFYKGENQKRIRAHNVAHDQESNQPANISEKGYEAYLRGDSKFINGHVSSNVGNNHDLLSNNIAGGNFNNLGCSPIRSFHSNPFGAINRRHVNDTATFMCEKTPYSTSADSGGSGENSASSHGYEDDFPELTSVASKFNNLRLDTDQIEAQHSGINSTSTGPPINALNDPHGTDIKTIQQQGRHNLHETPAASLCHTNGHVLDTQGSSRFISF